MTVKELSTRLQSLPPDTKVLTFDENKWELEDSVILVVGPSDLHEVKAGEVLIW